MSGGRLTDSGHWHPLTNLACRHGVPCSPSSYGQICSGYGCRQVTSQRASLDMVQNETAVFRRGCCHFYPHCTAGSFSQLPRATLLLITWGDLNPGQLPPVYALDSTACHLYRTASGYQEEILSVRVTSFTETHMAASLDPTAQLEHIQ